MSVNFLKPASSPFTDDNKTGVEVPEDAEAVTINFDSEDEDGIEITVIDDTPKADKGKPVKPNHDNIGDDDEDLEQYGEGVAKRISTLRHEFHNSERGRTAAERERDAAVEHAKQLQAQLNQVSGQSHQTTTALAKQMQTQHESAIQTTQALLAKAHEDGNGADIAKHTADLGRLQSELVDIKNKSAYYENAYKQQTARQAAAQQQQTTQQTQQQGQPQVMAEEAKKWLNNNPWFTEHTVDPELISKQRDVLDFNNRLLGSGRYTANDPALYKAVDDYVNKKYPEKETDQMDNGTSTSGQPPVSGVQTTGKKSPGPGKKKRTMELTKSEIDMARRIGVSLKQYALQKQKLEG